MRAWAEEIVVNSVLGKYLAFYEGSSGLNLVSSSTTLVWCTVSTREEREAEPSVVFNNVGPNTRMRLNKFS